jgi:branched-chain amino acid transport system ATP-binding protein
VNQPVLDARGLSKRFGGLLAVNNLDVALYPGRLLGVIGPNGAGKSTAINLLTGHIKPTTGNVKVGGKDLTGAKPWAIARAGVARTFQIVKPFRGLTVEDNVTVAAMFGPSEAELRRGVAGSRETARVILERVGLGGKGALWPTELSVGDARRLELAKALALQPRVLLLDEVLAGLRPAEIDPALELVDSLRRDGLALMMVEHVIHAITALADEVLVLHHGEVLTVGKPSAVLSDERVITAYLGSRFAQRAAVAQREVEP